MPAEESHRFKGRHGCDLSIQRGNSFLLLCDLGYVVGMGSFGTVFAAFRSGHIQYYVSVAKGLDVDKPRNLAKSVTVE